MTTQSDKHDQPTRGTHLSLDAAKENWRLIVFMSLFGIACIVVVGLVLRTRPEWLLSVHNISEGVSVEVFANGHSDSVYSFVLKDHQVARDIEPTACHDFPTDIGTTTFTDFTIRPGRWTIIIDDVELDIMPNRLVVDGELEFQPRFTP